MRSELVIEYIRLKKELSERGIEPIFLQGISRETGQAIIRHGIKTDEGYFMNSNGTVENVFKENEIIRMTKENDVYMGRQNLFIRFSVKESEAIYYGDGKTFKTPNALNILGIFPRNVSIPGKSIILPFDFMVTEITSYNDHTGLRFEVAIMGAYAYKRNAHYTYQDFGVPTEEVFTEDAVQAKNTWHQMTKDARMKYNLGEGGTDNVRILKNNQR